MCISEDISVIELAGKNRDKSVLKNQQIRENDSRYVLVLSEGMADSDRLVKELMHDGFLQDAGVVAFCAGSTEGVYELPDLLQYVSCSVVALAFDRDLLQKSGCYNEKLSALIDFELVCRLTEVNGQCVILPAPEESTEPLTEQAALTCAYIVRRHLQYLHERGVLEVVLNRFYAEARQYGMDSFFGEYVNEFLSSEDKYDKIFIDTAPFAVICGGSTCGGVLQDFAHRMANSLKQLGQAVLVIDEGFSEYGSLADSVFKGIIGFQSKGLFIDFFRRIRGRKFQFWFDHPLLFSEELMDLQDDYYILCQDAGHAEFMRRYFHICHAEHFPPGGIDGGYFGNEDRIYDIVFIGTYFPEYEVEFTALERELYDFMLANPHMNFETGASEVLKARGIALSDQDFIGCLQELSSVRHNVVNHFRREVIETILASGYTLHVYGDSWKQYKSEHKANLIIHHAVSVDESLAEWGKAKIGLNIMSWHKAGMTERVANIMLSGAVCLSDETSYLNTHFRDGENILTFRLDHLEELPRKIETVLHDAEYRCRVARSAYEKAVKEHTWKNRAMQLLSF